MLEIYHSVQEPSICTMVVKSVVSVLVNKPWCLRLLCCASVGVCTLDVEVVVCQCWCMYLGGRGCHVSVGICTMVVDSVMSVLVYVPWW